MKRNIARTCVSGLTYHIDRPYDYIIPPELDGQVVVGGRVLVPFGRGNRRVEAIVLEIHNQQPERDLKAIYSVIDPEQILDEANLKTAAWLREQFFCTLFEAARSMLPAGLFYLHVGIVHLGNTDGFSENEIVKKVSKSKNGIHYKELFEEFGIQLNHLISDGVLKLENRHLRNVKDKIVRLVSLIGDEYEILDFCKMNQKKAPVQCELLTLLSGGTMDASELCYLTGASMQTIHSLEKKGFVQIEEKEVFRRPNTFEDRPEKEEFYLNANQQKAYDGLSAMLSEKKAGCALLLGVTGSGKTAIYMKLIESLLEKQKGSIMLVPEISLTPQLVEKFYNYFGDKIAVLHSSLTSAERFDEWKRIKKGIVRVVVGTRSAIFAPMKDLGLIILDEEQEYTYKSSASPRYHAREVAKFLCVQNNALLILGSATPSIETMYYAESGRYQLFELEDRYNQMDLPDVIIADMKEELRDGNTGSIGKILKAEIEKNIENGEQSILFINRRGAGKNVMCLSCGFIPECPRCSVNLIYHLRNKRLMCHHCGFSQKQLDDCPQCAGDMVVVGTGTQKIEEELGALFPQAPILRIDADTTRGSKSHEELLTRFKEEKIPILVGTQMITKGLNFENVTLVGVLSADQSLFSDDFRASERTFSLLTQVVGRSGRGEKAGRAVIQTLTPYNTVIATAAKQDYKDFYTKELALRKVRNFPPFTDFFVFYITSFVESDTYKGASRLVERILLAKEKFFKDLSFELFGPAPAPILKINNKYKYMVTIAAKNDKKMREFIRAILIDANKLKENRLVNIWVDANPLE